jgi:hypothetical protein
MSEQSGMQDDWAAVIAAHPLESHEPATWLRYGVALCQRIEPSSEERQQQQQAGLAFAHAEALGASKDEVARSQRQATLFSLAAALELAEADQAAEELQRIVGWTVS